MRYLQTRRETQRGNQANRKLTSIINSVEKEKLSTRDINKVIKQLKSVKDDHLFLKDYWWKYDFIHTLEQTLENMEH